MKLVYCEGRIWNADCGRCRQRVQRYDELSARRWLEGHRCMPPALTEALQELGRFANEVAAWQDRVDRW
jgi:hypothetical protein